MDDCVAMVEVEDQVPDGATLSLYIDSGDKKPGNCVVAVEFESQGRGVVSVVICRYYRSSIIYLVLLLNRSGNKAGKPHQLHCPAHFFLQPRAILAP